MHILRDSINVPAAAGAAFCCPLYSFHHAPLDLNSQTSSSQQSCIIEVCLSLPSILVDFGHG